MVRRRWASAGALAILASLTFLAFQSTVRAAPPPAMSPELQDVLARFDGVQNSYRTLRAEFTETTHSRLLKQPIVAKGVFYMTKPDSVRWEYSSPEPMRFVISDNQYTGYFPKQKRAEKRDIHRWSEHLFRFLGLGQPSTELVKFYDISLRQTGALPNTYLIALDPKKKRVRRRMDEVLLWVDRKTLLPEQVQYSGGSSGTRRRIEFDRIELNPDLAASLYRVEIPPGVTVTTGFSALSGFAPSGKD